MSRPPPFRAERGSVTPLTLAALVMVVFVTVNLGAGVHVAAHWFQLSHLLEQYAVGQAGNALMGEPTCAGGLTGVRLTGCSDLGTTIAVAGELEVQTLWGRQTVRSSALVGYGLRG